jgi:hypothetical protein
MVASKKQMNEELAAAMMKHNLKKIIKLIDAGADIDTADKDGRTALMLAAIKGDVGAVVYLLDKGANKNATDKSGYTALTYAVLTCKIESVTTLLAGGVNPEVKTKTGFTALNIAESKGYKDIVKAIKQPLRKAEKVEKTESQLKTNGCTAGHPSDAAIQAVKEASTPEHPSAENLQATAKNYIAARQLITLAIDYRFATAGVIQLLAVLVIAIAAATGLIATATAVTWGASAAAGLLGIGSVFFVSSYLAPKPAEAESDAPAPR